MDLRGEPDQLVESEKYTWSNPLPAVEDADCFYAKPMTVAKEAAELAFLIPATVISGIYQHHCGKRK